MVAGRLSSHKVKMAMAIDGKNRHYKWSEIRRDHFEQTAQRCHLPDAPALIDELVARTPQAVAEVAAKLPTNFPEDLAKSIFDGLNQAANALGRTAQSRRTELIQNTLTGDPVLRRSCFTLRPGQKYRAVR
jgi:serine/threonine-protein kinase HipA